MMWFILLPWMDNWIWMLIGTPSRVFFIQAMTITADQSKAIHCEILFDQKNITQRKGEKTDGDKTGNHECAIAVTHWCLCTKTYATLCIYQPATVHSTPSIKRVSQNTMYNTLNWWGTKLPRSLHCSDAIIKTVGRWPPTRRQRPSDVWLRERTHTSSCSPEICSNIAKCPVNDSKYDTGRQHFQGMRLHRGTLCSSQLKGFSKESFWQEN